MIKTKVTLTLILSLMLISGCSSTKFLDAKMHNYVKGFYVERWYLNPEHNKDEIPNSTKFYGASADKIKHKFIIKYYMIKKNRDDTVEIPIGNMWKIKKADYLYIKDDNGKFHESIYAPGGKYDLALIPIKRCINSEWCKLYENSYGKELYIKKSMIYK